MRLMINAVMTGSWKISLQRSKDRGIVIMVDLTSLRAEMKLKRNSASFRSKVYSQAHPVSLNHIFQTCCSPDEAFVRIWPLLAR